VAGEDALLRVFVTADNAPGARIPPMRATFFESGGSSGTGAASGLGRC